MQLRQWAKDTRNSLIRFTTTSLIVEYTGTVMLWEMHSPSTYMDAQGPKYNKLISRI